MTQPVNDSSTPVRHSLWWRLVKSRITWLFFVPAVILHVGAYFAVSSSKTLRDMLFSDDQPARQVNLSDREIQLAVEDLIKLNRNHFALSLQQLDEFRVRLDSAQGNRLKALKLEDTERKQKIADGVWPKADAPDKTAKYFARIDIDPPPVQKMPMVDVETEDFTRLYNLHQVFEGDLAKLFERYHAIELSASLTQPLPLSKSLEVTRLDVPKRRPLPEGFLSKPIRTQAELDKFKRDLKDLYLETRDIVNSAARWVEMAESRTTSFSPSALFGTQTNIIPAPQPYYGHYLNPRLFRQVEIKQLLTPKVALGTRMGKGELSSQAQWMSLDRWYYIGPFAHPARNGGGAGQRTMESLQYKYPPESGIDLDATYRGRDNRELRWKYRAIGLNELLSVPAEKGLKIMPFTVDNEAYAVWYFYTELWSDEERTVVTSFASDDFGMCWVNGQLVYQSPPDTQPWVPFAQQGFRNIKLRKGFNRVLFKLENWTGSTGFSVIMMTYEDRDLIKAIEQDQRGQ